MRFPEAGGSASFARHAFNEVVSFGAAWAQMLNYIITIAISAFFVPHYLSIFWEPAQAEPVGRDRRRGRRRAPGGASTSWASRRRRKLNIVLAVIDFATQALLVLLGFVADLLARRSWSTTSTSAWRRPGSAFFLAIPVAMIAYTGIETISNLSEEARDPSRDIPRSIRLVAVAVYAIYFTLPAIALSALPVTLGPDGYTTRARACRPRRAASPTTRCSASSTTSGIEGVTLDALEIYVGVLAATILFIAANAGVIGASRITYSMASYRQLPEPFRRLHPRFKTPVARAGAVRRRRVDHRPPAGPDRLPRHDVLVRRDALVHHRARLDRRPARAPPRRGARATARGPTCACAAIDWPLFAIVGGLGTGLAWLVVVIQEPADPLGRPRLARPRLRRLRRLPRGGCSQLPLRETVRAPAMVLAGDPRRSSTARSWCRWCARPSRRRRCVTAARLAAERRVARRDRPRARDPDGAAPHRRPARRRSARPTRSSTTPAPWWRATACGPSPASSAPAAPARRSWPTRSPARAELVVIGAPRRGIGRRAPVFGPHRPARAQAQPVPGDLVGGAEAATEAGGRVRAAGGAVVLAGLLVVLGLAVVVRTIALGVGGGLGLLIGGLMIVGGGLRLYMRVARGAAADRRRRAACGPARWPWSPTARSARR